jgi:hypothetical protein
MTIGDLFHFIRTYELRSQLGPASMEDANSLADEFEAYKPISIRGASDTVESKVAWSDIGGLWSAK